MNSRIKDPFKINDWDIKSFLIIVLSIQLAYLGSVGLDKLDIQLPLLRQILGFIYLTFIPGYLLLRIFRIHRLSSAESFLYAIGLSLFFSMFIGFIMNILYPFLGITDKPISEVPIITTLTLATSLLTILAYLRDKDYNKPDFIDLKDILNPPILFLTLIPFMAIFGTYLVNYHDNNILLMGMIVVIALVCLVIGFTNWINEKYYLYAIWVMAISLVWHITLITPYVLVRDVLGEYYVAKYVGEYLHYWDFLKQIFGNYNSVLSITILPNIYLEITKISLNSLFKAIFPLIYSTIFIGIFNFHKKIFSNLFNIYSKKLVFISTLVVLFFVGSFRNVPLTIKQSISEIFMILLVLYIFQVKMCRSISYNFLLIIILLSIVVSHYGIALLLIGYILFLLTMIKLVKYNNKYNIILNKLLIFSIFYIIIFISWYSYISSSSVLSFVIKVFDRIVGGLYHFITTGELTGSRGAYIILHQYNYSLMWIIYKTIYYIIMLFIVLGALKMLRYFKKIKNKNHNIIYYYIYIVSVLYWLIIIGATIMPYFSVMSPYRIFHIFIIFSAPLFVYGFCSTISFINKELAQRICLSCLIIFITIYLIFNTGLIFEITKDNPISFSISQQTILSTKNINQKILLYRSVMFVQDVESSKWAIQYIPKNTIIYRFDSKNAEYVYGGVVYQFSIRYYYPSSYTLHNKSYFHLTLPNTKEKIGWNFYNIYYITKPWPIKYKEIVNIANKIYSNSDSEILLNL